MKIKALILGACFAVAALPAMADGYNRVTVSYENENYSPNEGGDGRSEERRVGKECRL